MRNIIALVFACCVCMFSDANASRIPLDEKEEKIKKELFENCLASSTNKYDLYKKCIGNFSRICIENPEDYVAGMAFSTSAENCAVAESVIWQHLFDELADKLRSNAKKRFTYIKLARRQLEKERDAGHALPALTNEERQKLIEPDATDKAAAKALNNTLRRLFDGPDASCKPSVVNWQMSRYYSNVDLECLRDTSAEATITVYLWNKELEAHLTEESK